MEWAALRRSARRVVHATFGFSAYYYPAFGQPFQCRVRVYAAGKMFGDLDREGFAQVVESVTQILLLQEDVAPKRGDVIEVYDAQYAFKVDHVMPTTDDYSVNVVVSRLNRVDGMFKLEDDGALLLEDGGALRLE